jgi:hypothetical protein
MPEECRRNRLVWLLNDNPAESIRMREKRKCVNGTNVGRGASLGKARWKTREDSPQEMDVQIVRSPIGAKCSGSSKIAFDGGCRRTLERNTLAFLDALA